MNVVCTGILLFVFWNMPNEFLSDILDGMNILSLDAVSISQDDYFATIICRHKNKIVGKNDKHLKTTEYAAITHMRPDTQWPSLRPWCTLLTLPFVCRNLGPKDGKNN